MSQRLALLQLHNELLLRRLDADREGFEEQLAPLNLRGTTLPVPDGSSPLGSEVTGALKQLASDTDEARVAPIEKLHLLVSLSQELRPGGLAGLPQDELAAVKQVANGLLVGNASDDDVTELLSVIDGIPEEDGVIRVRGLEEPLGVAHVTGPRAPPNEVTRPETVGDVLRRAGMSPLLAPQLVASLANHPVVDVEARIYRAVVDGQAEYPVHIRTTVRFADRSQLDLERLKRILEPEKWPQFSSFWRKMTKVATDVSVAGAAEASEVPEPVLIAAADFDQGLATLADRWSVVGTYKEEVGFDTNPDLYPDTYLRFARRERLNDGWLLSYYLSKLETCDLKVDDGCIELTLSGGGFDVVTTKSLYVSGVGTDTELAGILAYFAVQAGWGTHTLALVDSAMK